MSSNKQLEKMEIQEPLNSNISQASSSHFQNFLAQKIGFGQAQYKLCRATSLLLFSEGCETIVLGLLLPILKVQWDLSKFQRSILIVLVYAGVGFGSYIQSFSDKYGRKIFITWDIIIQGIFGLFSCICWNYSSFLFSRFCYGVAMGICFPLSGSYITQIAPIKDRASLYFYTRYWFSGGAIFTCLFGWYLLQQNHWRILLFIICIPGIYSYFEHLRYGFESLRFLWVNKRQAEVIQLVTFMCKQNNTNKVQDQTIRALLNNQQLQQEVQQTYFIDLFQGDYKKSTGRMMFCWFATSFIYYGVQLLLPSIIQGLFPGPNFKYFFIMIVTTVEVLSYDVCLWLMNNPKVGRKKSVFLGSSIVCIFITVITIIGQSKGTLLLIVFTIIKFGITLMFVSIYPYTAQIYGTSHRAKAMGICSLSGRIGVITMGFVGVYAIDWLNGNGLYLIFIFLSGASSYAAYTMPFCTTNRFIR